MEPTPATGEGPAAEGPVGVSAPPSPRLRAIVPALAAAVVLLLIASTFTAGLRLGRTGTGVTLPDDFANVELLFDAITDDAIREPGEEALVEGAINGLLSTLDDRYAVYYDADRYEALNADLDGEFVGIGITIEERNDGVYITGVLPGAPADEAGLEPGERIIGVDGASMEGLTSAEVVAAITGDEGDPVTLTVDMGSAGERDITMVRAVIDLPQVASRTLDSGYGYVAVSQFSRRVADQLADQITELQAQDLPGLVLDLRGNPGGLLNEAVDVVGLFVEEGVVVRVESRDGDVEHEVDGAPIAPDIPLVVLVDGGSASASEIVAGALQDLGRATIVGQTTFGKGTVQTIQDLSLGAGVKFTTAAYFTPSGDSIEGVGVAPDVETVAEDPEAQLAEAERVLAGLVAEAAGS